MLIEIVFFATFALDPNAIKRDLRAVVDQVPEVKEFIVGTSSGEDPFQFDIDWREPAQPEPEIFALGENLSWSDSFHLKNSTHMQIGSKKIDFSCALVQGRKIQKISEPESEEHYLVEVFLYQKHWRCQTATEYESQPHWLRFIFRTDRPNEMLGLEFSHLFNHFHAVAKPEND